MDLFDAFARRASYRGPFTDAAVPRADLERIAQAALQAPSACNQQVVSFVIVNDPKLLAELRAIVDRPVCETCRAMIICVADPRPVYESFSFAAEDCAAAVENMLLAITALGYASVWLDGVLRRDNRAARIAALLGIPASHQVRILLPIGVPAQSPVQKEKLPFARRAWFNQWGPGM